ncbi:MAG: hypothetical protein R3F30_14715 [Planctomycetota bacterium]
MNRSLFIAASSMPSSFSSGVAEVSRTISSGRSSPPRRASMAPLASSFSSEVVRATVQSILSLD